jgi:hypothetical protein
MQRTPIAVGAFAAHSRRDANVRLADAAYGEAPWRTRPELQHPTPDRFIGDIQPALGEQILDVAEAEGEAKVQPYRMPDDVRRELVASE